MAIRNEVLKVLEPLRRDKVIGSNQESSVTIRCWGDDAAALEQFTLKNFAALCIVSEVKLEKAEGPVQVVAGKSPHKKCQRCWNYWPSVGLDSQYPDVCERCANTLKQLGR
jgi:isoleucyl-tRNA synthetase